MPTTTTVTIPLTYADDTTTCCAGCPGTTPRTLHISNNHGDHAVPYASAGTWKTTYPASFSCSDAQPDPAHTPPPTPCLKPKDAEVTDSTTITVTIRCPAAAGGPWRIQYSGVAEQTYFRFVGATLAPGNCGGFTSRVVNSPASNSDASSCSTTQTFPAPATPWVDTGGHHYATVPDPGTTTMSA
jgi:hypothetical protein